MFVYLGLSKHMKVFQIHMKDEPKKGHTLFKKHFLAFSALSDFISWRAQAESDLVRWHLGLKQPFSWEVPQDPTEQNFGWSRYDYFVTEYLSSTHFRSKIELETIPRCFFVLSQFFPSSCVGKSGCTTCRERREI